MELKLPLHRVHDKDYGGRPTVAAPSTSHGGRLLTLVLVLTVVEGACRKWVFPNTPALRYGMYFSKDFVLIAAGLVGAASATALHRRYAGWVLLATVALILPPSLGTLGNASLVGVVLSLRAYSLVPLCAFLAAGTIRSHRCVRQVVLILAVLAIGEVALGMVQFRVPKTHWLNRYDAEGVTPGEEYGHVRAIGTFSYIGGMSMMAGAAGWAGTYLFLSRTRFTSRGFAVIVLISGLLCAMLAMSRTGVGLWLVTVGGGVLCFRRGRELAILGALALVGYLVFGGGPEEHQEGEVLKVAMKRFNAADSFGDRANYFFRDLSQGLTDYPLGMGLGVGQPGASMTVRNNLSIESEPGRIVQEVGIIGLAGAFFIRLLPFAFMLPRWRKCNNRRLLALYSVSIPFLFSAGITNLVFNHTLSSVYWCLVALVFGAAELPEVDWQNRKTPAKYATGDGRTQALVRHRRD